MKNAFLLSILCMCTFMKCSTSKDVTGIWIVERVNVGKEEMTPVARWTKFYADHTQVSGNGWKQHSFGTWDFNASENALEITNENGFRDEFGPFQVQLGEKDMIWTRIEEGQEVKVHLKRVDEIPTAPANKLLGIWRLSAQDTTSEESTSTAYLFFRWDQIFRQGYADGQFTLGVYNTHGHRNDLELFYYGDPVRLERWQYQLSNSDTLILSREAQGQKLVQTYYRTNTIPE